MPLMARYNYADGVNTISLVFLRNLIALPTLATGTATIFHFVNPSLVVLIGIFFFKKEPISLLVITASVLIAIPDFKKD